MSRLALESSAVQYPLVRHAVDGGWEFVPEAEALALRRLGHQHHGGRAPHHGG